MFRDPSNPLSAPPPRYKYHATHHSHNEGDDSDGYFSASSFDDEEGSGSGSGSDESDEEGLGEYPAWDDESKKQGVDEKVKRRGGAVRRRWMSRDVGIEVDHENLNEKDARAQQGDVDFDLDLDLDLEDTFQEEDTDDNGSQATRNVNVLFFVGKVAEIWTKGFSHGITTTKTTSGIPQRLVSGNVVLNRHLHESEQSSPPRRTRKVLNFQLFSTTPANSPIPETDSTTAFTIVFTTIRGHPVPDTAMKVVTQKALGMAVAIALGREKENTRRQGMWKKVARE